jgi:branched-chain amino acid transport system permease protein
VRLGVQLAIAAAGVAALAALPFWGSPVLVQFGTSALLLATLAQGWNIIGGYTGYPSFGNSVFYGLGGYGVGIGMVQFHWPFAAGLALGIALALVFAFLIGLPVLRLRGHYFAIATLGLAVVMTAIVSNIEIAGRNIGLVMPLVKGDLWFYEGSLALLAAATLSVAWISRSRFGFGLIAIRENEDAAAVMGVNTTLYKVLAFALCSVFTAIAGGINAYWITFLEPQGAFDIGINVRMIIMAVFGGPGTVFGPVLGAFVLAAISEVLASKVTSLASIFFGIVIVVAVIFMPRGFADLVRRFRQSGWRYFQENIRTHSV